MGKLVRDNIPNIIKNNNETPLIKKLDTEEYKKELYFKLQEEVNEFLKEDTVEEIVDILEVIDAILKFKKITKLKVQIIKDRKLKIKGRFKNRIYLKNTL